MCFLQGLEASSWQALLCNKPRWNLCLGQPYRQQGHLYKTGRRGRSASSRAAPLCLSSISPMNPAADSARPTGACSHLSGIAVMLLWSDAYDVHTDHIMTFSVNLSTCCAAWTRLHLCDQTTSESDPIAGAFSRLLKHRKGGIAAHDLAILS